MELLNETFHRKHCSWKELLGRGYYRQGKAWQGCKGGLLSESWNFALTHLPVICAVQNIHFT